MDLQEPGQEKTWRITLHEVRGLGIRNIRITIETDENTSPNTRGKTKEYYYENTDRPLWAASL